MKDNKLIAEFMGSKHPTIEDMYRLPHADVYWGELQYDYSWDWLMPVVEKIESLGYEVQIRNTDCIIFQLLDTIKYKPIVDTSNASGKKDSTYIAVVRFIKEYNQLKQE